MPAAKITIIEDEEDIRQLVRYNLEKEGYLVSSHESGEVGLSSIKSDPPDLVLLDLMLPGIDGMEVCRRLKKDAATRDIPVIILSAKGEEADIVAGLEQGADDYLSKPFSPKILLARIHTILRRVTQPLPGENDVIQVDELLIEPRKFSASISGKMLELTAGDYRLLHFLASHRGWVYTRYQIVDAIRGEGYVVTERAIDVQVAGLRKKLGEYGHYIQTVRGVGYRFKDT
ncbi:MAG: response regulator [Gammaproteobacteria bacterium]|jgi:two-component system phosphate regulon response regulator PhoB|nr:response regulator [Gammaproteobacteria bacterium]